MIPQEEVERTFALIEQAAIKGERCPQSEPFGPLRSGVVSMLYRTGRVRGEVYTRNFRVMTILTGPNAGRHTALPPWASAKPWKISVADGTHYPRQRP